MNAIYIDSGSFQNLLGNVNVFILVGNMFRFRPYVVLPFEGIGSISVPFFESLL